MNIKLVPLVLILALLLSALLSACTTMQDTKGPTTSSHLVDGDNYTFANYDQYLQHVQQQMNAGELPSNFVPASAFSIFGEFYAYVSSLHNITRYWYTFVDENGIYVHAKVYHNPSEFSSPSSVISSIPSNPQDMRKISGINQHASYSKHGLSYWYFAKESVGLLQGIFWEDNGLLYFVYLAGIGTEDYPMDGKETIFSRLLSIDENVSEAAFEELKAYMKANG